MKRTRGRIQLAIFIAAMVLSSGMGDVRAAADFTNGAIKQIPLSGENSLAIPEVEPPAARHNGHEGWNNGHSGRLETIVSVGSYRSHTAAYEMMYDFLKRLEYSGYLAINSETFLLERGDYRYQVSFISY